MESHGNLSDLPEELHKIIASSIDDKTRRYMRLSSTYWFNLIKYNEFCIYFARSTTLPEMVDRFAQYEGSIALRFTKEIQMDANTMSIHLYKLTNLTALSMSINVKSTSSVGIQDFHPGKLKIHKSYFSEKSSLSTLTNLQEWYNLPSFGEDNYETISNFSQLTKLALHGIEWNKKFTVNTEQTLRNNTNLEFLDADLKSLSIIPNPSRLTSLTLPYNFKVSYEDIAKFSNLKHFKLHRIDSGSFRTLTALESISTESHYLTYFDVNTTITKLHLSSSSDTILKTSLPNLVNLCDFTKLGRVTNSIDVPYYLRAEKLTKLVLMQSEEDRLLNLSRLTNLEYLYIFRPSAETDHETLEPIEKLTKLTQLILYCDLKSDNSPYVTKLTNLKSLILRGDLINFMTADVAPKLSNLEELRLNEYNIRSFGTSIESLDQPACYHTILTHFNHLTKLQLHNRSPDLWETLTKLSTLQALTIGCINAKDMPALTKLTALTDLDILKFEMTDREIFAKLTNLQRLWLRPEDKKDRDYFYSKLPYLHSYGWKRFF